MIAPKRCLKKFSVKRCLKLNRMVSQTLYSYLSECYAEAMRKAYAEDLGKVCKEKELQGYGKYDRAFRDYREGHLWALFDKVMCGSKVRMILSDKVGMNLYAYNGKWWERIDTDNFMKELVKRTFKELAVGVKYMSSCDRIARELQSTVKSSDEYLYKPNRRYIAFANGVFDLKDGKLKGHDSKYVTDIVLDIDYKSEKECNMQFRDTCKLWDNFICSDNGVFSNNRHVAADFQAYCGAFLMDREVFKFEYMACVHGPGSNGKSVLMDTVSGVFGEEYYSTFTPTQLFKEGTNSSFCVSDLEGKLLNIVGDLDKSDFSGGTFKRFISGEKIRAREPYGRAFRFIKPPLMICCANEFPETEDDSEGHHRRLLPFESTRKMWTEKDKDPNLTAKLTTPEARTYIFNWIYKGYRRIVNNGGRLPLSDFTINAQERLKANANSMRRWFADSEWDVPANYADGFWKPLKEMYAEYKAYCEANFYDVRRNYDLSQMLQSKGIERRRLSSGVNFRISRKEVEKENNE